MIFQPFRLDAIGETTAHKSAMQEIVFTDDRTFETIYRRAFTERHIGDRRVTQIFPRKSKQEEIVRLSRMFQTIVQIKNY